jgi:hypothetical protein
VARDDAGGEQPQACAAQGIDGSADRRAAAAFARLLLFGHSADEGYDARYLEVNTEFARYALASDSVRTDPRFFVSFLSAPVTVIRQYIEQQQTPN